MKNIFLHGSDISLPKGVTLNPTLNYEDKWKELTSYSALEKYRPAEFRPQKDSVFMVKNNEDLEYCGGGEEFVFIVVAKGKITKHDMNWATEISLMLDEGMSEDDERIKKAANNYWHGISAEEIGRESVWEYMAASAKIIRVYDFDTEVDLDKVVASLESKSDLDLAP